VISRVLMRDGQAAYLCGCGRLWATVALAKDCEARDRGDPAA